MKKIRAIIILSFVFALLAACGSSGQSAPPVPTNPPKTYKITYKVTGGGKAYLTYDGPNGRYMDEIVDLPWEKTFTWTQRPGQNATITVHERTDSSGILECKIYADGKLIETDRVSGEDLRIALCTFWP